MISSTILVYLQSAFEALSGTSEANSCSLVGSRILIVDRRIEKNEEIEKRSRILPSPTRIEKKKEKLKLEKEEEVQIEKRGNETKSSQEERKRGTGGKEREVNR